MAARGETSTARGDGTEERSIPAGNAILRGDLEIPPSARGLVLFAHGSGSGRRSPRNRSVAARLRENGLGTLLFDLLTETEEALDRETGHLRFDIDFLAERLIAATAWARAEPSSIGLPVGLFGASTGAAAALMAAARLPEHVRAVVSRGGRPDLAGEHLRAVRAPTLLIVGGLDTPVIRLNEQAARRLGGPSTLVIVPSATHLFEEPGALEEVSRLAAEWFRAYLQSRVPDSSRDSLRRRSA
jgi:pimeloyl-ACP methyl ester carboxylesterase